VIYNSQQANLAVWTFQYIYYYETKPITSRLDLNRILNPSSVSLSTNKAGTDRIDKLGKQNKQHESSIHSQTKKTILKNIKSYKICFCWLDK